MENTYSDKREDPFIISIVSTKSGMGKTTLIEKVIRIFKERGYSVGVLKHDAHKFEVDKKGKDSYRFAEAGADNVILSSKEKLAMIKRLSGEPDIEDTIKLFGNLDIIITEGFKSNNYPKIEVHRKEVDSNLLCSNINYNTATFIAVASNEQLDVAIPVLDINNVISIADFIEIQKRASHS